MLYRIDIPYGIRKFTLGETAIRHRIFGYGAAVAEPGIPGSIRGECQGVLFKTCSDKISLTGTKGKMRE